MHGASMYWSSKGCQEVKLSRSEEGYDLLDVALLNEAPLKLGAYGVEMEHGVLYLCCCLGKFNAILKDVVRMTMLQLFGDDNVMRIVIEGEDQINLEYLTATKAALKTSGKSTSLDCGFLVRGMAAGLPTS